MGAGETRLSVKGMQCGGCVTRAREALSKVPGVVPHGLSGRAWEQLATTC